MRHLGDNAMNRHVEPIAGLHHLWTDFHRRRGPRDDRADALTRARLSYADREARQMNRHLNQLPGFLEPYLLKRDTDYFTKTIFLVLPKLPALSL